MAGPCAYLDQTLPSPEENLALEEAMFDWCSAHPGTEILRVWEPDRPFVVLGHANAIAAEVDQPVAAALGVPVLRRCSGGGAVLQAPGCLNYALILRCDQRPELASVTGTHRFILERHRALCAALTGEPVAVEGISDLAIGSVKFSGNAQKRGRNTVLYHGTFLLSVDLDLMGKVLRMPSRRPAYRRDRSHHEFVRCLDLPARRLRSALAECWEARPFLTGGWEAHQARLLTERYRRPEWHRKF